VPVEASSAQRSMMMMMTKADLNVQIAAMSLCSGNESNVPSTEQSSELQ
jgi:hypothetical protein